MAKATDRLHKIRKISSGSIYDLPSKLHEMITWCEELLKKVPEAKRDAIYFSFDTERDYYESVRITYEVHYYDMETDDEYRARLLAEKESLLEIREKEKQLLAKLKKKYKDA